MNSALNRSPDELCHVEKGVIMTFRVIKGPGLEDIRTKEKTDIIRERSILEQKKTAWRILVCLMRATRMARASQRRPQV